MVIYTLAKKTWPENKNRTPKNEGWLVDDFPFTGGRSSVFVYVSSGVSGEFAMVFPLAWLGFDSK